ncbi:MAG: hypothetical protein K6A73_00760 [Bacteroidales bacterium]|nr:hypothetical protein [Bacteroidales bacterium]
MENKQQFSSANPLRILYLVDQSKSTELKAADGTPICNHFANTTNDDINNMIIKNSKGTRVVDRAVISIVTFCGEGIKFVCEGRLSELAGISSETPVYITPNAAGDSPLGRALETMYNRCKEQNEFYHIITIESDALLYDKERDNDLATALDYAELFKKQGTEIHFAHMTAKHNQACVCPSEENSLPDETSKVAFKLSSEMTDEAIFMANEMFGMNLSKGARWMSMNSDPKFFSMFVQFGSNSKATLALPAPSVIEVEAEEVVEDKM